MMVARSFKASKAGLACVLIAGAGGLGPAPAAAAPPSASRSGGVELSLSRNTVPTRLGKSFDFKSTIANRGRTKLSGLVAHLNIVALTRGVYVDPEDWSDERTRYLPPLDPGGSTEVGWNVKAVNSGVFAVYVVVVPGPRPAAASEGLAVSPALEAHVTERRTLNSSGVLPLALGVPALLGAAAVVARARRRGG